MRLHHVQVPMPRNQEALARSFYRDALGMTEVDKSTQLAGRGGCWFRSFDGQTITAEIHVGVDEPFVPIRKAHPAIELASIRELDLLGERIENAGFEVSWEDRFTFDSYERFHARDGFGNRVEFMALAVTNRE